MADMRERCRVCGGDGVAYEPYASYDTLVADTCPNCEGHGFVSSKVTHMTEERRKVRCDQNCGALERPEDLEEVWIAFEHWRDHTLLAGCSHGC